MIWVTQAKHIKDFELEICFSDGKTLRVDLAGSLNGKVFEPLRAIEQFKGFRVDPDLDTLVWDSGADFSPEYLYDLGHRQAGIHKESAAR